MMTDPEPLLPDLPPALEEFVRARYPDGVAARRALQVPVVDLDFRSAYDDRALWRDGRGLGDQDAKRRRSFETSMDVDREAFAHDRPFFPALGTEGTLRSPYPELSDADFWVFVRLCESEGEACRMLEAPGLPGLFGKSPLQLLRESRREGWGARLLSRLTGAEDPRRRIWYGYAQTRAGNYL